MVYPGKSKPLLVSTDKALNLAVQGSGAIDGIICYVRLRQMSVRISQSLILRMIIGFTNRLTI